MPFWLEILIVLAALVVLAPPLAWLALRFGAKARGGVALASVLLGLGAVIDQPAKHALEAAEPVARSPENGEPPLDDTP